MMPRIYAPPAECRPVAAAQRRKRRMCQRCRRDA